MRTLVMGGTRFVGLRTVLALQRKGHHVTTLNRGTFKQPEGVRHLRCDRKNAKELRKLVAKEDFDAVVDISAEEPEDTRTMVEIFQGRIERFAHCSSGAVYEDRWEFPVFEDDPLVAWTGTRTYPENKAQCERTLFEAFEKTDFPIVILRPTVIYGPHNYIYREAYVFDRAEARRPIPVPGDGKSVTHIVHVDDVADAFVASLSSRGCIGQAYNIAGPRAVTLDLWVKAAATPIISQPKMIYYDEKRLRPGLRGFPLPTSPWVMSIEKARRDLSFSPRDIFVGMKEAFDWYSRNHPFGEADFQFDELVSSKHK